jgi:predicted nucleotidyltransferase
VAAQFASTLKADFGARLRGIRLYGSAARGDWTPESDIDVLVLLDHVSNEDEERIVKRAMTAGVLGSGLVIQPVFMTQAAFAHLRSRERLFALEIEREGVDL